MRQVQHVERALINEFAGLVDMSDAESRVPSEVDRQRLSRSLAALAVRRLTGCDSPTAAKAVIDGRDDQGIDAIAFADGETEIFLVQAKWSARGTAGVDTNAARALVDGFRKLDDRKFGRFNKRIEPLVDNVDHLLGRPQVTVTLVMAVMGEGHLSREVQAVFDDAGAEFNTLGRRLGHRVINGPDFWNFVRAGLSDPPIELIVPMSQWLNRALPIEAYQGTVSADNVAGWFEQFGDRLFDRNVRRSLGLTQVNQSMVETLTSYPETFWSRNNGITVLCSAAAAEFRYGRRPGQPVTLTLSNASVVNGAQTVSAIHAGWRKAPAEVAEADVSVRVICVPAGADDLGTEITRSTNTQNRMERRDFVALKPEQLAIRDDFALSLSKTYVFKRGELDPAPDDGCSIVHAALALACAHRNPDVAVRAKRDRDLLWEEGTGGAYPLLFGNGPSALQIWRSVLLFRKISSALHQLGNDLDGRPAAVAEYGDLIVAHLVFQVLSSADIDDPDLDWNEVLGQAEATTGHLLRWLVYQTNALFGPGSFVSSTFANPERCRALVVSILGQIRNGQPEPPVLVRATDVLPPRARSTPTVHVLLDAARIEPGSTLTYVPSSEREQAAMQAWLAEDGSRRRATWVPERSRPLLWEADGRRYSPSGLVTHMWLLAEWEDAPVAIQGPKCWHLGSEGSLVDIATKLRRAQSTADQ
jgi:hypothetical protein